MRPRILFIINKLTYAGAGKMMAFVANHLSRKEYDVYLLAYEDRNAAPYLVPEVNYVDLRHSLSAPYALRRILQLLGVRKTIKEIKPDVIVSFKTYSNIIAILATMGTGISVIISERGDPYANQGWFTMFRDTVYHFSNGYVFQTSGAKKYFNQRIQEKAIVIPNPVLGGPAKWHGEKEEIIVNVGRFELHQKRQDILIHAFSQIAKQYPNIKLVLYGDGEDEARIREIIATCELKDRVLLAGITKNVYESIKKAKMFVLSSDYEGMPNALIEAMAVGLPCISTDCSPGGAAELIRNMENGILVDVGCIGKLASSIEFLLQNPDMAQQMGENAMKTVSNLRPDIIITQWENYIQSHMAARSENKTK